MARERDYQLGVVINPDVGEDQARTLVDRINNIIASNNGHVFRVIAWGRRRLAYPIEHHRDGLYYWFDMQLPADAVVEVERQLRVNEAIIRQLLTLRDARVIVQERERAAEAEAHAAQQAAEAAAAGEAREEPVESPAQAPRAEAVAGAEMGSQMGVETGAQAGAPTEAESGEAAQPTVAEAEAEM